MNDSLRTYLFAAATALILDGLPLMASAADIHCPLQITVHEQTDPSGVGDWQVFSSSARGVHHFYAVAFSQGPPADMVYFNPQKVASGAKGKTELYDFGTQVDGDLWISCLYRDTSQIMAKRLDPKPTKCQVGYDSKHLSVVNSVRCD